jgi:hypothetical protein
MITTDRRKGTPGDLPIILPPVGSLVRSRQKASAQRACLLESERADRIAWIDAHGWFMGASCDHQGSSHSWTYGVYEIVAGPDYPLP